MVQGFGLTSQFDNQASPRLCRSAGLCRSAEHCRSARWQHPQHRASPPSAQPPPSALCAPPAELLRAYGFVERLPGSAQEAGSRGSDGVSGAGGGGRSSQAERTLRAQLAKAGVPGNTHSHVQVCMCHSRVENRVPPFPHFSCLRAFKPGGVHSQVCGCVGAPLLRMFYSRFPLVCRLLCAGKPGSAHGTCACVLLSSDLPSSECLSFFFLAHSKAFCMSVTLMMVRRPGRLCDCPAAWQAVPLSVGLAGCVTIRRPGRLCDCPAAWQAVALSVGLAGCVTVRRPGRLCNCPDAWQAV
eukprot:350323-Chlamydomonas_euryale.AAC.2